MTISHLVFYLFLSSLTISAAVLRNKNADLNLVSVLSLAANFAK